MIKTYVSARRAAALVVMLGTALITTPAAADPVADFYRGKNVTIYIGFGVGGGYDTTTRIFARHFGKHVPGNPTIIPQNMPGGGSMKVANYIYNAAPKDGTALGMFASSTALEPLFGGRKTAKYETLKFSWVGSLHRDIASCGVWKGGGNGVRVLPDLVKSNKTILFGATSPSAITSQHPLFLKNVLGANVKVIYGYKGTKDVSLAMQRGEVHGSCGMFESSVRGAYDQHVKAGEFKVVVQFGRDRIPYFGDATTLYSALKTPEQEKLADLVFGQTEIARPLAAPPGIPADRLAALRKAMLATLADPALKAEATRLKIDFDPIGGEVTAKMFAGFFEAPRPLIDKAYAVTHPPRKTN